MILLSPEETCDELNRSHKPGQTFYIPERLPEDGYYGAIAKAQAKKIFDRLSPTSGRSMMGRDLDWQTLKKEIEC